LKAGKINVRIEGEIGYSSIAALDAGNYFGVFGFMTGLLVPQVAQCTNYCSILKISRADYKSVLSEKEKLEFHNLETKAFYFDI